MYRDRINFSIGEIARSGVPDVADGLRQHVIRYEIDAALPDGLHFNQETGEFVSFVLKSTVDR